MKEKLPISQWAEDDRPREKLLIKGKGQLSKAELIAILIGSGNNDESAVELSKRILSLVDNNLAELSKLSVNELCKFKGIGTAKAISIVAALEIGRRRRADDVIQKTKKIKSSKDAYDIFYADLSDKHYEEFWILLLDRANQIIKKINISEGGFSGTIADPKKIFKLALEHNSSSIILAHNHPSNNLKPSDNDIKLTKTISKAGSTLEISVLDHIIVGSDNYFSFADESMI
ncbi:MAG: DNA repair protein RadC [Bacteroidetes bacterium]|nr:DNA repair protein RadC [Bacteroidota bacterium]MBL6944545.1 DNA repair protein RadC [Bacteroidales bacterium]